ncbi:MAG: hypothetical protein QXY15_10655 [Candidatus Nitrosotenuis sp.]
MKTRHFLSLSVNNDLSDNLLELQIGKARFYAKLDSAKTIVFYNEADNLYDKRLLNRVSGAREFGRLVLINRWSSSDVNGIGDVLISPVTVWVPMKRSNNVEHKRFYASIRPQRRKHVELILSMPKALYNKYCWYIGCINAATGEVDDFVVCANENMVRDGSLLQIGHIQLNNSYDDELLLLWLKFDELMLLSGVYAIDESVAKPREVFAIGRDLIHNDQSHWLSNSGIFPIVNKHRWASYRSGTKSSFVVVEKSTDITSVLEQLESLEQITQDAITDALASCAELGTGD